MNALSRGPKTLFVATLALFAIVAPGSNLPTRASEALGDLDLRVRLLSVELDKGGSPETKGAARIELLLGVARTTESIRLTVEKADGSSWLVGSSPFDPEPVDWRKPDGTAPIAAADGRPRAVPNVALRSVIVVPLAGAAVHELVFRVSASSSGAPLITEAMVRVPLGVEENLPIEKDGVAEFKPKGDAR